MLSDISLALLFGRILLSIIFIAAALSKIFDWETTTKYVHMKKNRQFVIAVLPYVTALQLIGGLSLFFGFYTRAGALLLICFIVPASILFHNFWDEEGTERQIDAAMFLKNMAILGGLILLLAAGPGKVSLDHFLR
jgi:putative oxidoreductase